MRRLNLVRSALPLAIVGTIGAGLTVVLLARESLWAFAVLAAGTWTLLARAVLLSSRPPRTRDQQVGKR